MNIKNKGNLTSNSRQFVQIYCGGKKREENNGKCKAFCVTRKRSKSIIISTVDSVTLLGTEIDNKLNFEKHVATLFHFIYIYQGNIFLNIYPRIKKVVYIIIIISSCTVFIRSSPLLFELTYVLLQNHCINNGVTNGLNYKKEKSMQTALYGKIKEGREAGGEWLIGAIKHTLPFSCSNTAQDKTKARNAPINEVSGA